MTATSARASGFASPDAHSPALPAERPGRIRAWRERRRARYANAGAVRDIFLDVVVLLSVLEFLALVAGIGLLAMGSHVPWPR